MAEPKGGQCGSLARLIMLDFATCKLSTFMGTPLFKTHCKQGLHEPWC